jgi:predicted dehydrogenase
VRKVKELIEAGALGEIYFTTTQRVNLGLHQRDVSVVWDLGPSRPQHPLLLARRARLRRQRQGPRLHRP